METMTKEEILKKIGSQHNTGGDLKIPCFYAPAVYLAMEEYGKIQFERGTKAMEESLRSELINKIKQKADTIPMNTALNRRLRGAYVDCILIIKNQDND